MIKHLLVTFCIVFFTLQSVIAQKNFPINGVNDKRVDSYAFTNATLYLDYQTVMNNVTLVIKDGFIVEVGENVTIPKGAVVKDLKGKFVYPSFIDPYTGYGLPAVERGGFSFGAPPQLNSKKKGPYGWNEAIKAEFNAISEFNADRKKAATMRKQGFGTVLSFKADGITRGNGIVVSLADLPNQNVIVKEKATAHYSFNKGSSKQNYPSSIMGSVALLRQTYLDAQWYNSSQNKTQNNQSLKAFSELQSLVQVFEVRNKLRVLLADQVGDEFGVQYVIKGNGDEYQRINEIKASNASFIIPLNFPKAYDVEDPYETMDISLAQMKHWELAPTNPAILTANGVNYAFTASGLKGGNILDQVRIAIKNGLSEKEALKALTYTPANILKTYDKVGSLSKGKLANFLITSGNIFDKETSIYENWIQGNKYELKKMDLPAYAGVYDLKVDGNELNLEIKGKPGSESFTIKVNDSTTVKVKSKVTEDNISLSYKLDKKAKGDVRLSGWIKDKTMKGNGQDASGKWIDWSATYKEALKKEEDKKQDKKNEDEKAPEMGEMIYPFVAYGWKEKPKQETILFKNATVWTMEADSVLDKTDVLVKDGKIAKIGKDLSDKNAVVVNAENMHLTPGIIDEHSHIALSGVNEGSQSITAEVRMYDAVDSEDIDIYRHLAGGVTAAQLLHGSANPVGGQSALVKYRWGSNPMEMRIKGADGYIKFALGENVKQSNWGDNNRVRFPQTRMGVEQVFVDGFTKAKKYTKDWDAYNASLKKKKGPKLPMPRKDLELEALGEIINSKRFITCHSYVQSEINMLMKVAEKFDFRVNTFTHILEGYKVADKMQKHGVGGSTFGDWWQYKYEVREAIPYNASLMTMAGVTVAINSDDSEMARRLNQEAAKSVKYGAMTEYDAMKLVTLNPAKLLHIDNKVGSIKVGKDADIVLWNGNPLSIYSKPLKTLVDGIVYYDLEKDKEMREWISKERTRLVNKMRNAKNGGASTQGAKPKWRKKWDCEDITINFE